MKDALMHRLANGTLDHGRVAIAAALGSEAALATGIMPAALSDHYRTRIEQVASALTQRECLTFILECASHALGVWEGKFPNDPRPRQAVEAVNAWFADNTRTADFDALCRAAEQSHIDVDYPDLTEDVDPALCAAMEATGVCSHAACAVKSIVEGGPHEELCEVVGWVARFDMKSARDRQAQAAWQTSRLIELLLQ